MDMPDLYKWRAADAPPLPLDLLRIPKLNHAAAAAWFVSLPHFGLRTVIADLLSDFLADAGPALTVNG
jgi:hypothetical protein